MAFRADEDAGKTFQELCNYLIPKTADPEEREKTRWFLEDLRDQYGPAVEAYPAWHPIVANHDDRHPIRTPGRECGYRGLDHTMYFAHAFITCPYGDGTDIMDSVAALPRHSIAKVEAKKLDVSLYNSNATPILVSCEWDRPLELDKTVPLKIALPLILEKELARWTTSEVGETWETMRPYFMGSPHGSRSSLFVDQQTGQYIKKVWNALIYSGMYGPIHVGR